MHLKYNSDLQFYATNLGYSVGLNRENVGRDFTNTQYTEQEEINQKKYLRFMIRNLPTWYKVKTTKNAVRMMLYSFGLVGDFIYYFTKNYKDPTTGIGLNTLQYGDDVNSYGISNGPLGTSADILGDNLNYKDLMKLKCDVKQWSEFKKNRKLYLDMLKDLQGSDNDWILTEVNPVSVDEDLSNIPDEFFPSPHVKLWFSILDSISTGNFSTDMEKQHLINQAIMAIKPINTVFEGVTGVYQTLTNIYLGSMVRFRKSITLSSDGYADYWYSPPP